MGLNIGKTFGTDASLEENGVWVELGDGARILVARARNPKAVALFKKLAEPNQLLLKTNTAQAHEKLKEIQLTVFAKHILLGWEGVTEDAEVDVEVADGALRKEVKEVPVPYTEENAKRILKQVPDFFAIVDELSGNAETFRRQTQETSAKN